MNKELTKQGLKINLLLKFKRLPKEKSAALLIVLFYALISEPWVLISDELLNLLFRKYINISSNHIINISIIKGSFYVIISSILLYLFIYKSMAKICVLKNKLQSSDENCRALLNLLPEAVTITKENKYIYVNDAGAKMFGYNKPEQMIDTNIENLVDFQHHKITKNLMQLSKTQENKYPLVEDTYIRADGTTIDVEVTSCKFNYNGEPSILSVVRNVTEKKKTGIDLQNALEENKLLLDKMMKLDKTKTEFFSNMSHEFKTPLNIIFGAVQLLNSCTSNSEIKLTPAKLNKYNKLIKQNCYRLLRLINNLIDINKIDSGFYEMNYKNLNIINVIENISLSVVEFAENKGISLIFDTEVEEKIMACDNDKIERIILNLLSNSIKYTKPGGTIYVNMYDNKDSLTILIKDTGIGIPKDKLDTIFDRFKQVNSSLQKSTEGSGIGLSLVKSLVEKHNGKIWVESNEGEGTSFFINFPITILPNETVSLDHNSPNDNLVEKIHIEFSDIYSIS